ncbi:MDR family NADP-dependent oxidoreductase [Streptantibioticus rubrisoli]|uniref:NADP-dependent oxidoreductase n=1 Tax=Streptantibioticus rubrisoli TaxID=1387313 RepID=A0ABT1PLC6_9ACTN|nr:NADP-dependent oxidoreductase [Streptantibioticus rubrisoli]MCQ4046161.1 NADP-dependent oxidoreductase [Streptantibioticus rubrisoli]
MALPHTHRSIRLAARPDGLPTPEHFTVAEAPLPNPAAGEALIRNRYFRVSASLRMMISGGVRDVDGVPFPVVRPGETPFEETIGEVVTAPEGSGLLPGDLVTHWHGWREYAAVPAAQCTPLDGTLPDPVAHLSHAWTAYAALRWGAEVRPRDTVFVSGATGAIGSMAGQLARLLGAARVIGSTGSQQKADRLVAELGYDSAVLRGARPIAEQLAEVAPEGIDVLFDNVGGDQLRAAVAAARNGARFALVGALSGQLAPDGTGTSAPVQLDSFQLLLKRLVLRGFSADDVPAAERARWPEKFAAWLRSGDLYFPHTRVTGIERAPQALCEVIEGRHLGTVVVEL